jgi:hypothetical protein
VAEEVSGASFEVSADGEDAQAARMKKPDLQGEYGKAFKEVLYRVQQALKGSKPSALPVRMVMAGGAAVHLLTGERVTEDIDATFSRKVIFEDEISVAYRDPDGRARMIYLDRNYNDTLGLMHENAYEDSEEVDIPGIDKGLIDVRVLSPLDLAVTKLARFADLDRHDIETLAKRGLIDSASLRKRAEQALGGYVGNLEHVRTSIDVACRLVDSATPMKRKSRQ